MNDIKQITEELIKFRNERDWEQFHNLPLPTLQTERKIKPRKHNNMFHE